jgi:hypothetical protein
MANDRGPRYTQLLVFWLVLTVVEVRLGRDYGPCIHEELAHPSACRVSRGTHGELRIPLLIFLGDQKKCGYLVREMTLKAHRRRGARRVHHSHSLRPPGHSACSALQAPSIITPGALLAHTLSAREIVIVVEGAGAYLALIYLQTIEKNPGPLDQQDREIIVGIRDVVTSVKSDTEIMKTELQNFKERFEKCEKLVKELQADKVSMQQRLTQLERYVRRKNVIIFGVPETVSDTQAVETVMKDKLGLRQVPEYEAAFRLGKQAEKRPILVRLCHQWDKDEIMSNVSKLKGTRVVVSDDLTPEEQALRRTTVAAAKAAQARNIPCKVRRTGLLINNQIVPPAMLCDPDWLEKYVQLGDGREQQPSQVLGGLGSKRTFAAVVSPTSEAADGDRSKNLRPRTDSTGSNKGGKGGKGGKAADRNLSKERTTSK